MKLRSVRGYSFLEILAVMSITVVVAAIAVPMSGNALGFFRLSGDARKLSNALAVTKMRAASDFSQSRLYVDKTTKQFRTETFQKLPAPGSWVTESGDTTLSAGVSLSFGALATPPANTQAAIDQAPACRDVALAVIANTSCIVFNSRGIPIDPTTGAPTTADAVYITDGSAIYGITVIATGMIQVWRSSPTVASWSKQ